MEKNKTGNTADMHSVERLAPPLIFPSRGSVFLPPLSGEPTILFTLVFSPFLSLMTEKSYNERKVLSARKCFSILQSILTPAESGEKGWGNSETA